MLQQQGRAMKHCIILAAGCWLLLLLLIATMGSTRLVYGGALVIEDP